MADLELMGTLNFGGKLSLRGTNGGKVKADGKLVLVVDACGTAPPVIQPPPPANPIDDGIDVVIVTSGNSTVTASGKPMVIKGMCKQGRNLTWPGIVQPGTAKVNVGGMAVNVIGDKAVITASGGEAQFTDSGQ